MLHGINYLITIHSSNICWLAASISQLLSMIDAMLLRLAHAFGAKMFYAARFDAMDEGAAIVKCTSQPPKDAKFVSDEGLPSDCHLWLNGRAGKMLRGEILVAQQIPNRTITEK